MQPVTKVFALCQFITDNTEADVFFRFAGHCNQIEVDIHAEGWAKDNGPTDSFKEFTTN